MHSTEHHRKLNSPEAAEYLGISASTLSKRRVDELSCRSGTPTAETQGKARRRRGWPLRTERCSEGGRRRLGAPTGWVSGKGHRLVPHAKPERKIRPSRICDSKTG